LLASVRQVLHRTAAANIPSEITSNVCFDFRERCVLFALPLSDLPFVEFFTRSSLSLPRRVHLPAFAKLGEECVASLSLSIRESLLCDVAVVDVRVELLKEIWPRLPIWALLLGEKLLLDLGNNVLSLFFEFRLSLLLGVIVFFLSVGELLFPLQIQPKRLLVAAKLGGLAILFQFVCVLSSSGDGVIELLPQSLQFLLLFDLGFTSVRVFPTA